MCKIIRGGINSMKIKITATWRPKRENSSIPALPYIHEFDNYKEAFEYLLSTHKIGNTMDASIIDVDVEVSE